MSDITFEELILKMENFHISDHKVVDLTPSSSHSGFFFSDADLEPAVGATIYKTEGLKRRKI